MAKKTQKDRLFNILLRNKKGITAAAARRRGINKVSARIFDLRTDGVTIYSNPKTVNRHRIVLYRLDDSYRSFF